MSPIQILLLVFFAIIILLYFRRLGRKLFDRIFFLAIAATAIVMVARPDWANLLAQSLGVGRGADRVAGGVAHGVAGRRALYAPLLGCLQVDVEPGRALRPYPLGLHGPDTAARIVLW